MANQSIEFSLEEQEENINEMSPGNYGKLEDRLSKLVRLNQLQKSIVRQNMHNAMSPLSAISGYLELINMTLEHDASVDQIEHYRKKIENGVTEVNQILKQLNALYEEEQLSSEEEEDFLDVNLNWAVKEVCEKIGGENSKLIFDESDAPLYVSTVLYTSKLIIYKLITFAIKCVKKDEQVYISSNEEEGMAALRIVFNISGNRLEDITQVLSCKNKSEEMACIKDNSMNEGLLASHKLITQIGGYLRFKQLDSGKGCMSLSIPLA